jgi:membrane-associated progesterone receptor component
MNIVLVFLVMIVSLILFASFYYYKRYKTQIVQDVKVDRELTLQQLKEFNGEDTSKPLYVGINGKVYDVSEEREMYSKPSSYHVFTGTDATRLFAKNSVNIQDVTPLGSTEGLTEKELKALKSWEDFFEGKYKRVAKIKN